MKIVKFVAENFKRLSLVEITPEGNMVQITGRNGQGKTSVLDGILAAIEGLASTPSVPIRKGQKEAKLTIDMDEFKVTRTFRLAEDGKEFTHSLKVENKDGMRPSKPQNVLDGWLGKFSLDPLEFLRLPPDKQFNALRRFVPDIDFEAIDKANKADTDERRDINRSAKQIRAAAEEAIVPSGLPTDFVDEAALTQALANAGQHNGTIEVREDRRKTTAANIPELRENARVTREGIADALKVIDVSYDKAQAGIEDEIADAERRLAILRQRVIDCQTARTEAIKEERQRREDMALYANKQADAIQDQIDRAEPLPEKIDTAAIQTQLAEARRVNEGIRARNARNRQIEQAEALEAKSQALTEAMETRNKQKMDAIASAKMPIPGLGFGDGVILLNDLPFDQASDAEQLRASVGIAMAGAGKLRVMRIRDGSLLDDHGLKLLAQMADEYDCQVWLEQVDSSGQVGFVLEDGHIKQPDLLAAE